MAMMRALYANETKSEDDMDNESLTYYGGAVKALGGGKFEGYLVLFTGPDSPDLQGEFFKKSTDFLIENGELRPVLYRHGVHPVIKSRKLGRGKLTVDDVGVFLEGELDLRDNYEKGIYSLIEQGKLGLSSGSMGHLVTKRPNGKSLEIVTWPIGEASLTPNPVEPRTAAIPVKALNDTEILDDYMKSVEDEQQLEPISLAGLPALAQFCEDVSPSSRKDGAQRSESAVLASKEIVAVVDVWAEGYHAYTSRLAKRSENRFLKAGREISASTVAHIEQAIQDVERVEASLATLKSQLGGLHKISELSKTEQKAMDEQARFALWNYYRISGYKPEELEDNAGTTS